MNHTRKRVWYALALVSNVAVLILAGCSSGGNTATGNIAPPDIGTGTPPPTDPSGPGMPEIGAGSPPSGATGVPYPGYTFTVSSGGAAPFTWSETGALPPGLSLSATGRLSGTPVTAGTYPVTIVATDSSTPPLTGTLSVNLVIDGSPIVVNPAPPPAGTVNNSYAGFVFDVVSGGSPPFSWVVTAGALPTGLTLASGGSLSGTPTAAGTFAFTVTATDSAQSPMAGSHDFSITISDPLAATINMSVARAAHAATLLLDGKVLITGGWYTYSLGLSASAELYDPSTGFFTLTGSMTVARAGHTATLLADASLPNYGKVLIAGGDSAGTAAELYDPVTGTFTATGGMTVARILKSTATLLKTGKVLVTSGDTVDAELYDPASGTFSTTGKMTAVRDGHATTLLVDGRVLVTGGGSSSAELYDPVSGTFTATGNMAASRSGHTATLLQDGTVLVVGTDDINPEVFDAGTGTFRAVGEAPYTSFKHTASLRADGTVLIAGGYTFIQSSTLINGKCVPRRFAKSLATTAFFAPEAEGFPATGELNTPRDGHTATVLPDGTILIVGGRSFFVRNRGFCMRSQSATLLSSAELVK